MSWVSKPGGIPHMRALFAVRNEFTSGVTPADLLAANVAICDAQFDLVGEKMVSKHTKCVGPIQNTPPPPPGIGTFYGGLRDFGFELTQNTPIPAPPPPNWYFS